MKNCLGAVITSPIGCLGLHEDDGVLVGIEFLGPQVQVIVPATPLLRETSRQLAAWFGDPHFQFSLPLRAEGSEFRRKVWAEIAAIPCGEVCTYADIARNIASAPRAVGGACGANPLPIIVPCHRVVAVNGLGGFNAKRGAQDWLPIKRWLLAHEKPC